MKRIVKDRKFLIGLAVSLVLAMAVGSFAIGEAQTPVTPQAATTNGETGDFAVEGGTYGETADYHFDGTAETNRVLYIHPKSSETNITIKNKDPKTETDDRIEITAGPSDTEKSVNITLDGVNINPTLKFDQSATAALKIKDNAQFNVNIFLADDSENFLITNTDATMVARAGLEKSDNGTIKIDELGTLTIGVPTNSQKKNGKLTSIGSQANLSSGAGIGSRSISYARNIVITGGIITAKGGYNAAGIGGGGHGLGGEGNNIQITGGIVKAYGGAYGAGIGGGNGADGNNIKITGGVVEAYGGEYWQTGAPSGIGGGIDGTSTGNSISGNAVVMATSGLEGISALPNCTIDNGIVFKGYGNDFDDDYGRATSFVWNGGEMTGDVSLDQNIEIPANLTVPAGSTLSVGEYKTITLTEQTGAKYTVEGTLKNDGTVTLPTDIEVKDNGAITTKTDFYRNGSTTVYKTGYQTYQTSEGVQKYKDLPNPDDTTLLKNSLNSDKFIYWYYLDKDGKEVAIKDGDAGDNVEPNQHKFYEKRATAYAVTMPTLENGSVTSDVTEAYLGDTVTLTVTPKEGYELKEGSVKVTDKDGKEIPATEKDGKYTFTMPDSEVKIIATFEGKSHEITIDQPEHGTVTIDPESPRTGDEVTITLKPEEGYKPGGAPVVKDESGNEIELTPTGNPGEYKFTMPNNDLTVDVSFIPDSTPTPPEPTPEPTPEPSVNPDGDGGDGSGASSKTSDPFMGGAALALLGVATAGAILTRKLR